MNKLITTRYFVRSLHRQKQQSSSSSSFLSKTSFSHSPSFTQFQSKQMATSSRANYEKFKAIQEEISSFTGISALLEWDQLVMMPQNGSNARAKQLEALAGVLHEKRTNPDIANLCHLLLADSKELNEWEKAHVRDAKRNFERQNKIPKELAQKMARLGAEGYESWVKARSNNDFESFAPVLQQWVEVRREQAKLIDPSKDVYDVLLDEYERGLSTTVIDQVFDEIKKHLPSLISKIQAKAVPDSSFLANKTFDVKTQAAFSHQMAKEIGFDTDGGRLDVSVHPFSTSLHPSDVRMTTRYKTDDIIEGITGTIHETGHSLYEQGRNKEEGDLPASAALSMGIHESQSLLWERMVGLSEAFWEQYWPKLLTTFPQIDSSVKPFQFYQVINTVKPGFIRVEADEVTYPMHIILRYELERDLLSGKIEVKQLPQLWNEKMKQYLGIEPKTDTEGVLQDTHWSSGAFGYFPTYTLGAIYACQFFHQATKEIPHLKEEIAKGNFTPLRSWLNEKIHIKGSLIPSGEDLAKDVTGQGLNSSLFIQYLTDKYSKLYNL